MLHNNIIILAFVISIQTSSVIIITAQQDNFFCGKSWADASSDCENRQPCPNAIDEECTVVPGEICFADTLCSVSAGHGKKFRYASLVPYLNIEYDDISNTRFCGGWWAT